MRPNPYRSTPEEDVPSSSGLTHQDRKNTLNVNQCAVVFGVVPATIQQWRKRGRFPGAYKVANRWRFPRSDVKALIDSMHGDNDRIVGI